VDAGVELGHQDLDAEALLQRVERADVVPVAEGERDPADRAAGLLGGRDQLVGGTADRRVHEREPVSV
jgi:hypothetical protein